MKILYLAHRLPYPPNKGEKIRTFHQIQQLAKRHMIHLCSFVDDPDDLAYVGALRKYCASVEVVYRSIAPTLFRASAAVIKRLPLSVSLFYRKAFANKLIKTLARERFDCVLVSSSSMAQYSCFASDLPKVIDFIDVDCEKWRLYAQYHSFPLAMIYRLEAKRLAKYEEQAAHIFDHCILISEEERRLFQERVDGRPVSVISNGVDLEYFASYGFDFLRVSHPTIVFTGAMDYFPNVDAVQYFCQEVFPLVRQSAPKAQFYIVGRNPMRQVKALQKYPNVIVTGTVPDIRPYLARATVSVAPLRIARGVQNKVLESMAMGVPVVGTVESFKGIAATENDGIRIADEPVLFAQHVVALLKSEARFRCQIARQTRRYIERHHRWDHQGTQLERVLEEVVWGHAESKSLKLKSGGHARVCHENPARS
jgi:sugar transferase (PEP-CTERM/EpsH1 system associated)